MHSDPIRCRRRRSVHWVRIFRSGLHGAEGVVQRDRVRR